MPHRKAEPAQTQHLHAHRAGDARHTHTVQARSQKLLAWSLFLTLGFAAVEVAAGFWSNSLALISDAGHMVTDAMALGLALLAQHVARRPPSSRHSFGFGRAEALAAFVNSLVLLGVVGGIAYEAFQRMKTPEEVKGTVVFVVATIGFIVNVIVATILSRDKKSVNTRAALVHVLGDLLGSIAAMIAGAVIYATHWLRIDPILSIVVSLLIFKSTIGILKESYHFLMEGVPDHIDYAAVGDEIVKIAGVLSIHDLHVWEMSPGEPALIGHVEIRELIEWPSVLRRVRAMLLEKFGIDHVTLQPELPAMADGEDLHHPR